MRIYQTLVKTNRSMPFPPPSDFYGHKLNVNIRIPTIRDVIRRSNFPEGELNNGVSC